MPIRGASHYRVRSMVVAVVIGGHVAVLALLAIHHVRETRKPADERMVLIFLDPIENTSLPRPFDAPPPAPGTRRSISVPPAPADPPAPPDSNAISAPPGSPRCGKGAHGTDAPQRAAAEPATRDFGAPSPGPAPRE